MGTAKPNCYALLLRRANGIFEKDYPFSELPFNSSKECQEFVSTANAIYASAFKDNPLDYYFWIVLTKT